MGKHDLKAQNVQVDVIDNKQNDHIVVKSVLRYNDNYDTSHPNSLIKRQDLIDSVGVGVLIAPWDGGPVQINQYRTYEIGGVIYLWWNESVSDNVEEPSFDPDNTWQVVGGGGSLTEPITFSLASGSLTIDFTVNNRQALFPYPHIEVWIVDGSTETLVNGLGVVKNKAAGLITSITLDGVFGSGYILIY